MNKESRRKLPFKPATVNRRMACLRHLFSKAVEWKIIQTHPCHGVKQFKENNRRLRYLTAEECSILLDASPSLDLKQMIELALHTGLRKSEVFRVKWEHVNLRQEYLEILDQKNGEYSTIPLDKRALEILRSIPRRFDSPYVFTGKIKGQPYWDLKRQFEEAVKTAKLEGVTFHTTYSGLSHGYERRPARNRERNSQAQGLCNDLEICASLVGAHPSGNECAWSFADNYVERQNKTA
jgi:integrase